MYRSYDGKLWSNVFDTLLNTRDTVPPSITDTLARVVEAKLRPVKDFMFRSLIQKSHTLLNSFHSQK